MTTLLAGVGPAGRGVLTALLVSGRLDQLCADGFVVVDPAPIPGGGALSAYNVRSDSAAAVFAECVRPVRTDPEVATSPDLAAITALPDGETVALSRVGGLLGDNAAALLRRARSLGADVRLGTTVRAVDPRPGGGALVTVSDRTGRSDVVDVSRLVLAVGGDPFVPDEIAAALPGSVTHSDVLLRPPGLREALRSLPPDPRVLVVGRAHSAFSVADRLLSADTATRWGPGAVTMATRGPVRVTYPDVGSASADGASFTEDDVCPQSGRVWRLCGLRGDSAHRYRLGRDGSDPRLSVARMTLDVMAEHAAGADLVVAATGYRATSLRLVTGAASVRPDGTLVDAAGRSLTGIRSIGLGSGSRRSDLLGGERSYTGPVDGVWHYQSVLAPGLLADLLDEPADDASWGSRDQRRTVSAG